MSKKFISTFMREKGFTLVELMIALVLGLLVVLAATAMLLSSRSTYRTQDEGTRLQESSRFALELTNRIIRLAGYTSFGENGDPPATYLAGLPPNVFGTNNAGPNGSDTLTLRYFGAGTVSQSEAILNCIGAVVPASTNTPGVDDRSVNTFYVALDPSDNSEPALYCSNTAAAAGGQALIRGVEDFQVLYGVPIYNALDDPDAVANPVSLVFKRADQMNTANPWGTCAHTPPNLTTCPAGTTSSDWDYVRYVRIAMLLRSNTAARSDQDANNYLLFGTNYPAGGDNGSTFNAAILAGTERSRLRRIVSSTITVRNRIGQWPTN